MVTRPGVNAALRTYLAAGGPFYPIVATFIDWPNDPTYAHTGTGPLSVAEGNFSGVGKLAQLSTPPEELGLVPATATITLIGVPGDLIDNANAKNARGRIVRMWLGFATKPAGNSLIPSTRLLEWFTAFITKVTTKAWLDDEGNYSHAIEVQISTGPRAREAATPTHSYEDQITQYPGDTAGRHVIYSEQNSRREFWMP